MSMSFEEALQRIHKKFTIRDGDRESYTKDAEDILNFIIRQMKIADKSFECAFQGLSLTGSYLDGLKIDAPDEFDVHIKLQPFSVRHRSDPDRPGFLFLCTTAVHRITENGFVNRELLQEWIRELLVAVIGDGAENRCTSGRTYRLYYPKDKRGYGVAHTIRAEDTYNCKRTISFDLVPVFEFPAAEWFLPKTLPSVERTWFAVPQGRRPKDCNYKRTFMVCAPHQEREDLKNKMNLKNSLRLMKGIRDANGMPRLTSYMLKSVYLAELDQRADLYWEKPVGVILVNMLECLVNCLARGRLPFYWDIELNHLDRLTSANITDYREKCSKVMAALRSYQNHGRVTYGEVARLFGIN